jgi:hypothetical protein
MRVWLISVAIFFVLAEIYLWLKDFILPLPIYMLGGAFLAIASNYEKGIISLFQQESEKIRDTVSQTATLIEIIDTLEQLNTSITSLTNEKKKSN